MIYLQADDRMIHNWDENKGEWNPNIEQFIQKLF